jgi:hypothetical protein
MNTKIINIKGKTSDGKKHECTLSEKGLYTNFFHDKEFASYEFPKNWWGQGLDWNEFVNLIESFPIPAIYWESLIKRQLVFISKELHNFENN